MGARQAVDAHTSTYFYEIYKFEYVAVLVEQEHMLQTCKIPVVQIVDKYGGCMQTLPS